jgi:VIT1/CCC1 family predicted Fe2+/Mn2+ transporter
VGVVIILGFANLVADGISMGLGDYLSEKAEIEYVKAEKAREKWYGFASATAVEYGACVRWR